MGSPFADRAAFAVSSRLLACFVTETLLDALFVPISAENTVGVCVLLSSNAGHPLQHPYHPTDIFAIIPLRSLPILKLHGRGFQAREIALVDPTDMLPCIYEIREDVGSLCEKPLDLATSILSSLPLVHCEHVSLTLSLDPVCLWKRFSATHSLQPSDDDAIAEELKSSFLWQKHAYENCPPRPILASSNLEWEHALIEGHPTHPMHRARRMLLPMAAILPGEYDFYHPHVRFVAIPRKSLHIQGSFERLLAPLYEDAECNAGRRFDDLESRVLFPVHELQIPNIIEYFLDAEVLSKEFSVLTPAQASIRTVTLPCAPGLTLKLAIGMKISSSLRTISHFTAHAGPSFARDIFPKLAINRDVLVIEKEVASAVYDHPDPNVAKHCTAVIRETYTGGPEERVIPTAALMEIGYDDADTSQPVVVTAFNLTTPAQKFVFLTRYIDLVLDALIPPLLTNGIAFEAHAQNTLVRFSTTPPHALVGFVIRDSGGIRVHPATLSSSTGVSLDTLLLPGHCIVVSAKEELYTALYHTLIHCHLQRLIRVLGLHTDGRGWDVLRRSLKMRVPRGTALWRAWLEGAGVMGKCLVRMKMEGDVGPVYRPVPNLIQFKSQQGASFMAAV